MIRLLAFTSWLACLALGGCNREEPIKVADPPVVTQVEVGRANYQVDYIRTYTGFGRMKPPRQLEFRSPGNLSLILIRKPGEKIKQGEILAQFDVSGLQRNKSAIQAAISRTGPTAERNQLLAQLADINRQMAAANVIAPFDLIVKSSVQTLGVTIKAEAPIMQVVENGYPRISIRIPRWVTSLSSPGDTLKIYLDGQQSVCSLEEDVDTENNYASLPVILNIQSTNGNVSFDDYFAAIEVQFYFSVLGQGFWVPISSLDSVREDDWRLFVIDVQSNSNGTENIAVHKSVNVIAFEEERALVSGEIQPGMYFIRKGRQKIVSGQPVSFREPEGASEAEPNFFDKGSSTAQPSGSE